MSNEFRHKINIFSQEFSLDSAPAKTALIITRCTLPQNARTRLAQLGMVKNATVTVIGKAPMGDPLIISVQGYSLCLRAEQAKHFFVRTLGK